jgi:diaminopimelate epimerase
MGEPHLELERVPADAGKVVKTNHPHEYKVSVAQGNELVTMTFVNIGNPHGIIFVSDVAGVDLERVGPVMERHPVFPKRANVHWVQVISRTEARMRTWERGSGITLACGTGASSVLVAGVITGRLDRKALIHLPGGDLQIEWRESDNCVYMTGPATEVFSGEWEG